MALSVIGQAATADSFIGHLKNKIYTQSCCCRLKITYLSADDTPGFWVTTVDLEFQWEQGIVSQYHVHTQPWLFMRDCVKSKLCSGKVRAFVRFLFFVVTRGSGWSNTYRCWLPQAGFTLNALFTCLSLGAASKYRYLVGQICLYTEFKAPLTLCQKLMDASWASHCWDH